MSGMRRERPPSGALSETEIEVVFPWWVAVEFLAAVGEAVMVASEEPEPDALEADAFESDAVESDAAESEAAELEGEDPVVWLSLSLEV